MEQWLEYRLPLSQGQFAIIDPDDAERVGAMRWFAMKVGNTFYAATKIRRPDGSRRNLYLHRFIANDPDGQFIDHKNHNGLDNRKANLRVCNHSENMRNQQHKRTARSKFKGVNWNAKSGKWRSTIFVDSKLRSLGSFADEQQAAMAYNAAAVQHFGEFAHVNVI